MASESNGSPAVHTSNVDHQSSAQLSADTAPSIQLSDSTGKLACATSKDPPPLFHLGPFLQEAFTSIGQSNVVLPRVSVVDVGAMALNETDHVWAPLQRCDICESIIGFEPIEEECEKATTSSASSGPGCKIQFLPYALGDGSRGEFRLCSAPMTSSMLEPNVPLLSRFVQLAEVTQVVQRSEMHTKRLDELKAEIGGRVDFLKLDVQGYELSVLRGAKETLRDVLVVHTEVEFVELYNGQPLFAEVDQLLRSHGFVFHRFSSIHGRPMKPLYLAANPLQPISQQLWADAVYVRDLWELHRHTNDELLRAAFILHEIYHSYDIVRHLLGKLSEDLGKLYMNRVMSF